MIHEIDTGSAVKELEDPAHSKNLPLWLRVEAAKTFISSFEAARNHGYVNTSNIRRILDFGAGLGGPTIILRNLSEAIGADLEAVEHDIDLANEIVEAGILPKEKVHATDGIAFLERITDEGESYDLITACMLGPDFHARLFRALARAGGRALKDGGQLFLYSEEGTMRAAQIACESAGVPFNIIEIIREDNFVLVPQTLVIPKASLLAI